MMTSMSGVLTSLQIEQIGKVAQVLRQCVLVEEKVWKMHKLPDLYERAVRPFVVACRIDHTVAAAHRYAELLRRLHGLRDG
jgi:hypothetical protein